MAINRLTSILMASAACAALGACGADDIASPGEGDVIVTPAPSPTPTPTPTPTPGTPAASCPTISGVTLTDQGVVGNFRSCRLPALFNADATIPAAAGVAYEINGRVDVGVDLGGSATVPLPTGRSAILTIQAGAILYGNGAEAANDFLVVNRGSQIQAVGTVSRPIIFTSRENVAGTVAADAQGQWGGVIIAGRAPISNCNTTVTGGTAACVNTVEGTGNVTYGGEIANDSSGSFQYVQIRYSGVAITPGNELQGLTTGGVGSATTVNNIQVHNSADDGIEVFGGRHNARYLVMTGTDDDALDTDVGHQGAFQFVLAIQRTGNGSSDPRGFEIDSNNNEDAGPRNDFRVANFTLVQAALATSVEAILLRGGTDATLANGIVTGSNTCLDIDAPQTIRAADPALIGPNATPAPDRGPPVFQSLFFQCAGGAFQNDTSVTAAEITTVFTAAPNANNTQTGTNALTALFIPSGAAATTPAFNASTANFSGQSFLVSTTYIGAVRDASDTWYRGWTCDSPTANFSGGSAAANSCTSLPVT